MKARVYVSLKPGVLDPQGKAIHHALESLGFGEAQEVRVGRFFDIQLKDGDKAQIETRLKAMSDRLLANPVIENFRVELL
jgi:phosphoribosylformylglycinamidine synthase